MQMQKRTTDLVAQEQTDRVIRVIALEAVGQDLRELVLTRCKAVIATQWTR
jgi:hypothetical protein